MNVSPDEAEEALAAVQKMTQRTRQSIARSGAHIFLIVTGIVWLVGFLATQFLSGAIVVATWIGISLLGSGLSIGLGNRMSRRMRNPAMGPTARRAAIFWLLLVMYAVAVIAVVRPTDGKQVTLLIILFIMVGQSAMGLLLSFASTWWALPIAALALAGYFWLPDFFYLWMAILVGGGMIALGLYIRLRW